MMLFVQILVNIAVLVFVGLAYFGWPAYIKKKGENLATKEDVREITRQVESIKTQYAAQLHVSQVRYVKEFEILSDLSEKLVELRDAALSLRPIIDSYDEKESEEERKRKRLSRLYDAMKDLYKVSETKRPFYPEQVYQILREFDKATWTEAVGYRHRNSKEHSKYWDEAEKNSNAISELANKALNTIHERVKFWEQ